MGTVTDSDFAGKWKGYFFWPKDFTFVCPTEIAAFGKLSKEFEDRDAQLLGGSTDSEFVHLAWRQNHEDLKDLPFPMLADVERELSSSLGILDPEEGVCQRATYIVDPDNVVRFVSVNGSRWAAILRKCCARWMLCKPMSRAKKRSRSENGYEARTTAG